MIPAFLRFYGGYTVTTALQEYAITFFALCGEMIKLKSVEAIERIQQYHTADPSGTVSYHQERAEGADRLLKQAKVLKDVRKRR